VNIKYLKHPVTIEEKQSLNKHGFKIIDIKFKPVDEVEEVKPKRKVLSKGKQL